jgi:hypothetical protein
VPFWGFLYLVPEKLLLVVKLTDSHGKFVTDMRIEQRETSASCNGGTMIDTCGFINIGDAKQLTNAHQRM